MAKKQYVLIIDTETTMQNNVADFGGVLVDKKGRVEKSCGVLVKEFYENEELFWDKASEKHDPEGIWSRKGLERRQAQYKDMIEKGTRSIVSVNAINRWIDKVIAEYDPYVTAYNFPFDKDKCNKSGIDLTSFKRSFCLWRAATMQWGKTKSYKQFILDGHSFNAPTKHGNMTYKTNAETMARFVLALPDLEDEPHTALEDALYYEKPILDKLWRQHSRDKICDMDLAYSWRNFQVRDNFTVK